MTTDRTQAARSAAPTDRAGAKPAEHRNGDAFAALLDAHAATRGDDRPARHDARADHRREHPAQRAGVGRGDVGGRRDGAAREEAAAHAGDQAARRRDHVTGRAGAPRNDVAAARTQIACPESAVAGEPAPQAAADGVAADLAAAGDGAAAARADLAAAGVPVSAPEPVAADLLANGAVRIPVAAAPVTDLQTAPEAPVVPQAPAPAPAAAATPVRAQTAPEDPTAPARAATPAPAAPVEPQRPSATPDLPAAAPPATAQAPAARVEPAPLATAAPAPPAPAQPAAAAPVPKAEPQAAAPAEPTAQPVAPAPQPQPSAPVAGPHRAEPLHRAPAAVATLLHVAAERGITRAKMALRPAELGGIEIRLQSTAAGVAAQVVADSPEAARLLAHAADDLRRALEARDVTLLSLEISTSSDHERESARGEWSDGDGNDAGLYGSPDRGGAEPDAEPAPTTHSVIELPGGLLVDVLA